MVKLIKAIALVAALGCVSGSITADPYTTRQVIVHAPACQVCQPMMAQPVYQPVARRMSLFNFGMGMNFPLGLGCFQFNVGI